MKLPEYALGEKTAHTYLESLKVGLKMTITQAKDRPKGSLPHKDVEDLASFFLELTQHIEREMLTGNVK